MRTFLRRVRGLAMTALLWTILWALVGILVGIVLLLLLPFSGTPLEAALAGAVWMGLYGTIGGALFAAVLMVAERRRSLESLSLGRVATWGALGGMGMPLLLGASISWELPIEFLFLLAVCAALGAACSTATLALARRPVPTRDDT